MNYVETVHMCSHPQKGFLQQQGAGAETQPDIMRGKSLNWSSPWGSFPCRWGNPMKERDEKTIGVRGAGGHQANMAHQIKQGEFTRAHRD